MRRREFITLVGSAATWPLAARAEQMPVIGFLSPLPSGERSEHAAFRRGLAEEGYVEGKNLAIEKRFANFRPEQLNEAAGDLVRLKVNVIFAGYPEAVAAARNATSSVPTVAVDLESDPLAMRYIASLARPGGNLTGMFLDLPELSGKQVGLLKEMAPGLSHIAIFGVPGLNSAQFAAAAAAVRAVGVEAEIIEVQVPDDWGRALEAAKTRQVQAGILLSSPLVFISSKQIGELALANRLPLISLFAEFPKAGGLIAYGPKLATEGEGEIGQHHCCCFSCMPGNYCTSGELTPCHATVGRLRIFRSQFELRDRDRRRFMDKAAGPAADGPRNKSAYAESCRAIYHDQRSAGF